MLSDPSPELMSNPEYIKLLEAVFQGKSEVESNECEKAIKSNFSAMQIFIKIPAAQSDPFTICAMADVYFETARIYFFYKKFEEALKTASVGFQVCNKMNQLGTQGDINVAQGLAGKLLQIKLNCREQLTYKILSPNSVSNLNGLGLLSENVQKLKIADPKAKKPEPSSPNRRLG